MSEDDRVGPRMSDDYDPLVRIVHGPQVPVIRIHRMDAVRVHGLRQARGHSFVEVPETLTTRETVPHLVDVPQVGVGEDSLDVLDRRSLPFGRILDLFQPIEHLDFDSQFCSNGLRGLDRSPHGGDPDLVDAVECSEAVGRSLRLFDAQFGQRRVVPGDAIRSPVGLTVTHEEQIHGLEDRALALGGQYDGNVARADLVSHLKEHALRTDGPFTLRSGAESSWYLDAKQTTFDGAGATTVAGAVLEVLGPSITAVGGMTMGADPIAVSTAMLAASKGRRLRAFSIRKSEKKHGTGGRLVGPVVARDEVAILEDTTSTGEAAVEAVQVAVDAGLTVAQVIALVDRSDGAAAKRFASLGVDYQALVLPADLGVSQ